MVQSMFTAAYQEVVQAVVALRKQAGLTQRDLAQKLGREHSYIGRIETGQRRLDIVEMIWICKICGVDPDPVVQRLARSIAGHTLPRQRKRLRR